MPEVSIIVPVYNSIQYIRKCVDSIVNQTYKDFELILIDDGSTDGSDAVCDEYADKYSFIRVFHIANSGVSAARNKGIEIVLSEQRSNWIVFVDSDDWMHEKCVEALYNAASIKHLPIAICEYQKVENNKCVSVNEKNLIPEVLNTEEYYKDYTANVNSPWGKIIHKSCFSDLRFPVNISCGEDTWLMYQLLYRIPEISVIREPLYYYYQSPESAMRAAWTPRMLDVFKVYDEQLEFFKMNHYEKAFKKTVMMYVFAMEEQIKDCSKNPANKNYTKMLRRMFRKHLHRYHQIVELSVRTHPWYYELAYPHLMQAFWMGKRIKLIK